MKELGKLCRLYCHRRHRTLGQCTQGFQHIINELPSYSTSMPPKLVLKNEYAEDKVREVVPFDPPIKLRHKAVADLALRNTCKAGERRRQQDKVCRVVRPRTISQCSALTHKFFPVFGVQQRGEKKLLSSEGTFVSHYVGRTSFDSTCNCIDTPLHNERIHCCVVTVISS